MSQRKSPMPRVSPQNATAYRTDNAALVDHDRNLLSQIISVEEPTDEEYIDIARLCMRYWDSRPFLNIREDLQLCLSKWNLSKEQLFEKTRKIWFSGYRPSWAPEQSACVGSGADVEEGAN